MKPDRLIKFLVGLLPLILTGCAEEPDYKDTLFGNFDALAEIMDTRYCFFKEKGVDWNAVTMAYRDKIKELPKNSAGEISLLDYFDLCASMLDELQDGHVNLSSYFTSSYYRKWWSDYPQDFDLRTLQEYYLKFNYYQTSGISYTMFGLEEDIKVGYMYYPSFSSGIGALNLDYILTILSPADALIIDIRNNGGGLLTNVETLVGRFIDKRTCGGYIKHKTGPGHEDFSEPYEIVYNPAPSYRVSWENKKPVYILTNRSCFSAANDFVSVMKILPNVKIIGARTGGGGGLPFTSELPNGWSVRFSASPIYSPGGEITEFGIDPSPGCEVHCTAEEFAAGSDAILDFALSMARRSAG